MVHTSCVIAGGGPAGIMLGLLLARAGIEVTVLEKHPDFLVDFRGDTVHPTTLDLLDELGLGDEFAKLPARRLEDVSIAIGGRAERVATFRNIPGKHKCLAMVPQWDLLDLLAKAAAKEPSFTLRMRTVVTGLVRDGERVTGLAYRDADGVGEIQADLVVACDGRDSVVRDLSGLALSEWPVPMDVWWFRLPRRDSDPAGAVPVLGESRFALMLDRGTYWQCATLIAKGTDALARSKPVSEILESIAALAPWVSDRTEVLGSWDDVKLLHVRLSRLKKWHSPGLLCIGDAAHAMSPVGGVGINLAVQDAVAAARILAEPLRSGSVTDAHLARVQRRRMVPTVLTQNVQRVIHATVMRRALGGRLDLASLDRLPLAVRIGRKIPIVRSLPTYFVARGVLPEHIPEFARR